MLLKYIWLWVACNKQVWWESMFYQLVEQEHWSCDGRDEREAETNILLARPSWYQPETNKKVLQEPNGWYGKGWQQACSLARSIQAVVKVGTSLMDPKIQKKMSV